LTPRDISIRQHIHDCRLFVPVSSAQTDARPEGYFRREWKLAVDRTYEMSERVANGAVTSRKPHNHRRNGVLD